MKIGDEVFVHGYVDEIRKDCIIIRNDGGYFGTVKGEIIVADTPQTEYDKYCEKIRPHDPHKDWFEDEPHTDCGWGEPNE